MADKKEVFSNLIEETQKAEKNEKGEYRALLAKIYWDLNGIDCIDAKYMTNFNKLDGDTYNEKITHIDSFSFENCCTVLTFLIYGNGLIRGIFTEAVDAGEVLALLQRAYDLI